MQLKIIDITKKKEYEKYLYKCLAPMPFRKYKNRQEYLKKAIPVGFHKNILEFNGKIVGQIEYAPAGASGLPIFGKNLFVMNCIWVLRKAKGNNFGRILLEDAISTIRKNGANGIATIALENHPSPWLKIRRIEKLGFKAIKTAQFAIVHKKNIKAKGLKYI